MGRRLHTHSKKSLATHKWNLLAIFLCFLINLQLASANGFCDKIIEELSSSDNDIRETSETSEPSRFNRLPELGELVVLEGLRSLSKVRPMSPISYSGVPVRVKHLGINRREFVSKLQFALLDRDLVLKGVRPGNIYSDGLTTYGVVGFVNGRIMLQFIETKSSMPQYFFRNFKSIDIKDLESNFRPADYKSYNRPLLVGDRLANLEGEEIQIDSIDKLNAISKEREKWALLSHWNPSETGGIALDQKIQLGTQRTDLRSEQSNQLIGVDHLRTIYFKNTLYTFEVHYVVKGVFSDGTFLVRSEADQETLKVISAYESKQREGYSAKTINFGPGLDFTVEWEAMKEAYNLTIFEEKSYRLEYSVLAFMLRNNSSGDSP